MANPAKHGKDDETATPQSAATPPSQAAAYDKPPIPATKPDIGKSREEIELEQELEGFRDLAPDRADGWMQPAAGAYVLGRLLGRFVMAKAGRKKQRAFYQVKVKKCGAPKTKDNPAGEIYMVSGKGDDSTTLPVQKGVTLAIDERKAIESLAPYAESDGVFDVFIQMIEKIEVAGGEQTFWRCNVRTKQLKAPSHPVRASSNARAASDEDDDIPF
jgi:hypothetical protein